MLRIHNSYSVSVLCCVWPNVTKVLSALLWHHGTWILNVTTLCQCMSCLSDFPFFEAQQFVIRCQVSGFIDLVAFISSLCQQLVSTQQLHVEPLYGICFLPSSLESNRMNQQLLVSQYKCNMRKLVLSRILPPGWRKLQISQFNSISIHFILSR